MSGIHAGRTCRPGAQEHIEAAPRTFVDWAIAATTVFAGGILTALALGAADSEPASSALLRALPATVVTYAGTTTLTYRRLGRRPALLVALGGAAAVTAYLMVA